MGQTGQVTGYDVIGDVHGLADRLENLLRQMDYEHCDGAWSHRERTAVFVGDLIDRGEQQLETLRIVQAMVEAQSAQIVLGNHEFNAVAYATVDPEGFDYCRIHSNKNNHQHEAFLAEVGFDSPLHQSIIRWFMEIPLWLDLGGIRVVHACWNKEQMDALDPLLGEDDELTVEAVVRMSRKGSPEYDAVETLLKGPEIDMGGCYYFDKDGHRRGRARSRWWPPAVTTLREAAIIPDDSDLYDKSGAPIDELPETPLEPGAVPTYSCPVPVFVGHYWETGKHQALSCNVACVDYSAGKGGPLVAYRWSGEKKLDTANFIAG